MGRLRVVLLVLVAWTVPAVLSTSLTLVREANQGFSPEWWPTLIDRLAAWWLWALLTPVILYLAGRIVIRGPRWWIPLLKHAGVGIGIVILYVGLEAPYSIYRETGTVSWSSWANGTLGGLPFQFITCYLIYFALVGAGHAIASARALQERDLHASRLETQLAASRLESLRAQLQPHFLFNTLHAIGGLVREGDQDRAVRMISGLSGLLRHTLDEVNSAEIPLHAELEALEHYIEIEEVRFEDRLDVERRIDPDAMDALVPALLLQPLVENAVRHGIERRSDAGRIEIAAHREGASLLLSVSDDGGGLSDEFDIALHQGLGLRNTMRVLNELYGERGSIGIEHNSPHGTNVTVRLPYRVGTA